MSYNTGGGYAPLSSTLQDYSDENLPTFNVEKVPLQFSLSADIVAAQVANNVLIFALSTGRILRIDLNNPADIDGQAPETYNMLLHLTLESSRYRSTKETLRDRSDPASIP